MSLFLGFQTVLPMKSMINKYTLCVVALTLLITTACKLDDTTISGVPQLEYTSIEGLSNKVGAETQVFTINANEDQEITGTNGVKIVIPQDVFRTSNGEPVNGMIDIELQEILTKSEMVLSNKPSEADGAMLETVGAFSIEAIQNNNALTIDQPLGVELNMNSNIDNPTALSIYYGNAISDGSVNWVLDSNSDVPLNAGVHAFDVNQLEWANCAKPLVSSETHKLTVSPGFRADLNDQNGFLIFDDSPTVVKLIPEGEKFVRDDFPSGKTATVVMIAIDPIAIYLSVVPGVNLTEDKTVNANHNVVTEAELISTIEGLN